MKADLTMFCRNHFIGSDTVTITLNIRVLINDRLCFELRDLSGSESNLFDWYRMEGSFSKSDLVTV